MDPIRRVLNTISNTVKHFIGEGELGRANTISANIMASSTLLFMSILLIFCLICNEIGLFQVDKTIMRVTILIALVVQCTSGIVCQVYNGDKPWMRAQIMACLIFCCSLLTTTLGHNAVLAMVIPVVLATRYTDDKFTIKVAIWGWVISLLSCIACSYYGVLNLNMVRPPAGTEFIVITSLRDAIQTTGFDQANYIKVLLTQEFVPRSIIYLFISVMCVRISKRGQQIIELQRMVTEKNTRVDAELNLATEIQHDMLPNNYPAFPEHQQLELFAKNTPAKEVGGDFYDYFRIDDDHVAIVIADVSGKGVGAALFMTVSKVIIKNQMQLGVGPAAALTNTNAMLCENNNVGLFVTVWAGVYEISTGIMTYTNAGHNAPILHRKGSAPEYILGRNGFVVAGLDEEVYTESQVKLESGDEIILYTDGVTEATNEEYMLYGETRLLEHVRNTCELSAHDQIDSLLDDIGQFVGNAEQFDDITILVLRVD